MPSFQHFPSTNFCDRRISCAYWVWPICSGYIYLLEWVFFSCFCELLNEHRVPLEGSYPTLAICKSLISASLLLPLSWMQILWFILTFAYIPRLLRTWARSRRSSLLTRSIGITTGSWRLRVCVTFLYAMPRWLLTQGSSFRPRGISHSPHVYLSTC